MKTMLLGLIITFNSYAGIFDIEPPLPPVKLECKVKQCDVYFNTSIEEPQAYLQLAKDIRRLDSTYTVTLHLVGSGGSGAGLMYVFNALKYSQVHTIGSFEGDVASAHTLLLVNSDEIQVNGTGFLLFHAVSGLHMEKQLCKEVKGTVDRGVDGFDKCVQNTKAIVKYYNDHIDDINVRYLTADERRRYYAGWDVIITSEEFQKRLEKKHGNR